MASLTFSNIVKNGLNGLKTIGSRLAHPIETIKNTPVSFFRGGTTTPTPTPTPSPTLTPKPVASSNPVTTASVPKPLTTQQKTGNDEFLRQAGYDASGKSLPTTKTPTASNNSLLGTAKISTSNPSSMKPQAPIPSPYTEAVSGLQGIASGKNTEDYNYKTYKKANQTLQNISENQTPEVKAYQDDYNKFAQENPYMIAAQHNPNVAADIASGRSALLGQTFAQVGAAKQQAVTNSLTGQQQQINAANEVADQALTGQGQQITAGQQAGNLTQPVANAPYFGSPTTGNIVGTGSGGTGNNLIDTGISTATQLIRSGSTTQDAIAQAGLGNLGPGALQALTAEMRKYDPNWTPTSSNAIAQQNMSQGQSYQEQAAQLDTGLKQLDIIAPTAVDFLTKSGLNDQDSPFYNKAIKEYMSQLGNPADVKVLNALMADISKYTAQILGATGEINPTRVGEISETFDPSSLNASQLKTLLTDLKKLGDNQLSVLQSQSKQSYGGSQGYSGSPTSPNTSLDLGTQNPKATGITTNNPVLRGLIGAGMNAVGGVENFIKGFASTILK